MKYTQKQILESVKYWKRQLQTIDLLECVTDKLNESYQNEDPGNRQSLDQIKDIVQQNVKDSDDVVSFIKRNDDKISATSNSKIKSIWIKLKSIASKGAEFIYQNWSFILLAILAIVVFFKGPMWVIDKLIYIVMWLFGYGKNPSSEQVQKMVNGTCPELMYKDVIDKYNNKPWFDDGTVGTF